jgi:hypothetical protein
MLIIIGLPAPQTDVKHTQEGIGHGHKLAGKGEGKQKDGKWRRAIFLCLCMSEWGEIR